MRGKTLVKWFGLFLMILFLLPFSAHAAMEEKSLLGEETPLFTLPSTHDRAITYLNEYYGKHHLIITFFPAAFTPT
jgi:hypothetical protein